MPGVTRRQFIKGSVAGLTSLLLLRGGMLESYALDQNAGDRDHYFVASLRERTWGGKLAYSSIKWGEKFKDNTGNTPKVYEEIEMWGKFIGLTTYEMSIGSATQKGLGNIYVLIPGRSVSEKVGELVEKAGGSDGKIPIEDFSKNPNKYFKKFGSSSRLPTYREMGKSRDVVGVIYGPLGKVVGDGWETNNTILGVGGILLGIKLKTPIGYSEIEKIVEWKIEESSLKLYTDNPNKRLDDFLINCVSGEVYNAFKEGLEAYIWREGTLDEVLKEGENIIETKTPMYYSPSPTPTVEPTPTPTAKPNITSTYTPSPTPTPTRQLSKEGGGFNLLSMFIGGIIGAGASLVAYKLYEYWKKNKGGGRVGIRRLDEVR